MNLRSAQFAKVFSVFVLLCKSMIHIGFGVATDVAVRSKFPKNFAFKVELNRA